ncbi:protein kinase 1 [Ectropis obliqua nucleopolyhedrovirus]|nr:protein kinase 1 [Ectropis obliqua nucleopolyhedrovirus]AAQ88172.1 protein kinase 1 [Ectropis obliqua nucleopolyhedrovirus]AGS47870.1 serine/threonine protein kinase 1 [Ectropis obliqua nucleopolyhedrovirus]
MFSSEFNDFCKHFVREKSFKVIDGKFGSVSLYKHKPTQKNFIVKYIKTKQFNAIEPYVHYLMKGNKHFVNLYYSFNWLRGHLLIMDYVKEGDLFDFCQKRKVTEIECKHIVKQIVEALNALHMYKLVHNDIKLENVLCDDRMHVTLCDYGMCQHIGVESIYDGTVDYFSPEKIKGANYDAHFDWWAVAILIYELLTHHNHPFKIDNDEELTVAKLEKRQFRNINFDRIMSTQVKSLLQSMLTFKLMYRLKTYKEIINHSFFIM